ncbi:MAG: formylglycine-generating enzyme family protein [Planctomycetota bacterium]
MKTPKENTMIKSSGDQPAPQQPLTLEKVNQYIWAKYIDSTRVPFEVNEDVALKLYEQHYAKHPLNEDDECFYYGILLYEAGFRDEKNRARYLVKAKEVFEVYRQVSGETEWDVIEDRLADTVDIIKKEKLEAKVAKAEKAIVAPPIAGMVFVPAGKFLFGEKKEEKILEAFYIDIEPITNAQYKAYLEQTKYPKPSIWERHPDLAEDELPLVGVSWMDAVQYCKWAGKELPTEEQWEKAARGEDGRTYPWGEDKPTPKDACFREDDVAGAKLVPTKGYDKNKSPYGCHVMVGHVWEWTKTTAVEDGTEQQSCIVKGGSWSDPNEVEFLSTFARLDAGKKEKIELIGFRCAKLPQAEKQA